MTRRLVLAGALVAAGCTPTPHHGAGLIHLHATPISTTTSSSSTLDAPSAARPVQTRASRNARRRTPATTEPLPAAGGNTQLARASWYSQGARTADGHPYNPDGMTFANRTMRFGTAIRFCHQGRCVEAVCTDRGPYAAGREFDLSRGAFSAIAPLGAGVITVTWQAA